MTNKNSYMPQTVGEMLDRLRTLYTALTSQPGVPTTWTVNAVTYTTSDLAKLVLGWVTIYAAVQPAEQAWHQAVSARDAVEKTVLTFMTNFLKALETQVGEGSPQLADYGFRSKKEPAALTVNEKKSKVDKSLATRQKNHTLGPDQKKVLDEGATTNPPAAPNGGKS